MDSTMFPRDMTLSDVDGLALEADDLRALHMTEEAFRAFYERTARPLWAYLARTAGEPHTADDLLQEAYYRLLRAAVPFEDDAHRKNYLFRIATNLLRDRHRRRVLEVPLPEDEGELPPAAEATSPHAATARREMDRAIRSLRPRDRQLLWLAYAQGMSHAEISGALGLRTGSVKQLLYRARTRLADVLGRPAVTRNPLGEPSKENGR
jgi:RNA polymerase sigma-70 factor, ECF subfamily